MLTMASPACVGLLFFGLAAIFLAAALRDYLSAEGKRSLARRTWVRIAIIFAVVGIGLQLVPVFLGP
jgi:H+/Cl- antiporter ClcA